MIIMIIIIIIVIIIIIIIIIIILMIVILIIIIIIFILILHMVAQDLWLEAVASDSRRQPLRLGGLEAVMGLIQKNSRRNLLAVSWPDLILRLGV